jgi:hypothetical protein
MLLLVTKYWAIKTIKSKRMRCQTDWGIRNVYNILVAKAGEKYVRLWNAFR